MNGRESDDEGFEAMLGKLAKQQAAEADAWRQAVERGEPPPSDSPDLRPLDDLERARMTRELFGAPAMKSRSLLPRVLALAALIAGVITSGTLLLSRSNERDVPLFHMTVSSGARAVRSATTAVDRYSSGSRFELIFQPDAQVSEEVEVKVLLAGSSGAEREVTVPIEKSEGGAFRIRGEVGRELSFGPGPQTLIILMPGPSGTQRFEYRFEISDSGR